MIDCNLVLIVSIYFYIIDAYEILNIMGILTWLFFRSINHHVSSMNERFMIMVVLIYLPHGASNSGVNYNISQVT